MCWPCGAKKPTRHPLRRPSSAELFGAIAQKKNSFHPPQPHDQTILKRPSRIYRGPCLQRLVLPPSPGCRVGFFAPQGYQTPLKTGSLGPLPSIIPLPKSPKPGVEDPRNATPFGQVSKTWGSRIEGLGKPILPGRSSGQLWV